MNASTEPVQAEVVVVGAGPAGLSAALSAAQAGAQVTLIDNYRQPGGQYHRQPAAEFERARPASHQREGKALWEKVAGAGVKLLADTTVWGLFEDKLLALDGPGAPPTLQAGALILATGATERTTAFPGWTLPGVMTSGAAQTLLKEQHILPGQRFVLAGTGPLQLVVAAGLVEAGAEVVAVLEGSPLLRPGYALRHPAQRAAALWGQWDRLAEGLRSWRALRRAGVPFQAGWGVVAAHGQGELTGVTIAQLDDGWRPLPATSRTLDCDTLCISYGFVPATELTQLLGAGHEWRPEQGGLVPVRDEQMEATAAGVFAVGDGAGIGGAGLAQIEGRIAGLAAAARVSNQHDSAEIAEKMERLKPALRRALRRERRFQQFYAELFTPGPGLDELAHADTVICRCEGVTRAELIDAVRKGADTLDAVKGLTRCGMGNCQGRVCGPSVAALVAGETGQTRAEVGQFRVRPPVFPIPLAALVPFDPDQPTPTLERGGIVQ